MAELIGHIMANWPTWLIGVAAVVIIIVGALVAWYASFAIENIGNFHSGRDK